MRSKFTDAVLNPCGIHWMECTWAESALSWEAFRNDLLGPTDISKAGTGSLRGAIAASWESLGLDAKPSGSENGVHASASALEACLERQIWLGTKLEDDPLTDAWARAGLDLGMLRRWLTNPEEAIGDGPMCNVFDAVEGKGTSSLVELGKLAT
eukprot:SAG31_NODE_14993_length_777_cov_0.831858_1_plen_154_part_00